jgi:hypothetical protein
MKSETARPADAAQATTVSMTSMRRAMTVVEGCCSALFYSASVFRKATRATRSRSDRFSGCSSDAPRGPAGAAL